jgi:hypothetical protein
MEGVSRRFTLYQMQMAFVIHPANPLILKILVQTKKTGRRDDGTTGERGRRERGDDGTTGRREREDDGREGTTGGD